MNVLIKPLTPNLVDDFLFYFDNIGFTDNPEWSVCYCYFHHFPGGAKEFEKQTKEKNRSASIELIKSGKLNGFLAYENDKPIGWCKTDLRENFINLPFKDDESLPENIKIAAIACFLIAPTQRRQGIARKLLQYACSSFKSQGYTTVEGYPRKGNHSDAHSYHGPISLYKSEGFTIYKELENFYIMRKTF
ncbi:MAG: GNAT family N-acetyltransferase [Promethearchaeota archaeon]|jgi:ribosomal protein S18 acetylase RimI-like enzyme